MKSFVTVFDRLLPALLMASSVTLLTAGLLSYAPSAFGDWQTPEPVLDGDPLLTPPPDTSGRPTTDASADPGTSATPAAGETPTTTPTPVDLTPTPSLTTDPNATPTSSETAPPTFIPGQTNPPGTKPTPRPQGRGFATRIRIPSLHIDLPVVAGDLIVPGNRDFYPLCDVAMFMREYVQPGETGATYIYAHAQRGMFAPLLKASQVNNGASMVGALIEVYTSDNKLHLYELYRVKRHATDLSLANAPAGAHMLVLQTSEGVSGTIPKLQVAARPLSVVPASASDANPRPRPRLCLPH
ncbi:MAG: sortase [Chloroflexota bacterium]